MKDVAIVGCGVVGAAAAYALSQYQLDLVILERQNDVSCGTSKANSAILHAGYDPKPGTLMARLNVEGVRLAKELCHKLSVPYRQCGSLVLAFSDEEMVQLGTLFDRGRQNGVKGLEILDAASLREREPNLSDQVTGALWAPTAAIVSPWELTLALAETAVRNGVELRRESEVTAIESIAGGYRITLRGGETVETRYIINAAGIHADEIHDMVAPHAFTIHPDRGEYFLLDKSEGNRVGAVVFQCPTEAGKGVLVAPTVHGNLIVGPNAQPQDARDDLSTTMAGLDFVRESAKKSVPSINFRDNIRNFSGLRAVTEIDDFIIQEAEGAPGFVDLAGIKSPGLSAAPAIANMAVEILQNAGLLLQSKSDFVDRRERLTFSELSPDEKTEAVRRNPSYGRVICRCVTVTEGEILDALQTPIPPLSVDGVKRRCNAGMGRCQGGFCGPRVVEILARELGVSPLDIPQDLDGSNILVSETKGGARHV